MHLNGNELEQVARRCTAQAARKQQGKKKQEPNLTDQRIGLVSRVLLGLLNLVQRGLLTRGNGVANAKAIVSSSLEHSSSSASRNGQIPKPCPQGKRPYRARLR